MKPLLLVLLSLPSLNARAQAFVETTPASPAATTATTTPASSTEDVSQWPKVIMPTGTLPAGTNVKVTPLPADENVFVSNTSGGERPLKAAVPTDYVQVHSVENNAISAGDRADLQAMTNDGSLRMATADLKASATCATAGTGGGQNCQLKSAVPVSVASATNPSALAESAATPASSGAAPVVRAAVAPVAANTPKAVVAGITPSLDRYKSAKGGVSRAPMSCPMSGAAGPNEGNPTNGTGGSPGKCAVKQALAAYEKGKASGKVTNDVIVVNDFGNGAAKGKMYFVHASDGSPAFVGVANPIDVARGQGGFGKGAGSNKTPDGAIATLAYHPPRSGNVKDGIELIGLEKGENDDINGRGVLLHGWNPNSTTHGCMGVEGTLTTGHYGKAVYGQNLDILKKTLFANGGVMIYNFTPKESAKCFQDVAAD